MTQSNTEGTVVRLLRRIKKDKSASADTSLYAEGIGLDSLEAAELSAMLEDEFGTDPFSAGETPQTVGDVVAFYEKGDDADAGSQES